MINELDELRIYKGDDIPITKNVIITQPTIAQIMEFGESRYFNAIYTLVSVGADMKWQLWDMGIDYTEIDDYDLFIQLLYYILGSKKDMYRQMLSEGKINETNEELKTEMFINPLELILKDIDLADFTPMTLKNENEDESENDNIILYNKEKNITIDRFVYAQIVEQIRSIHGLKRNNEMPGNEATKMILIEDARENAIIQSKKPYKSILKPIISFLSVKCGQIGDERIWNMKINMLLDNYKRANKIQDAELLLQGAYSGNVDLKGIDKSRLDCSGEI